MRANEYLILDEAVENGVSYGYERAHKHTDNPDAESIKDAIRLAVMNEICQYFFFDGESDDDRKN